MASISTVDCPSDTVLTSHHAVDLNYDFLARHPRVKMLFSADNVTNEQDPAHTSTARVHSVGSSPIDRIDTFYSLLSLTHCNLARIDRPKQFSSQSGIKTQFTLESICWRDTTAGGFVLFQDNFPADPNLSPRLDWKMMNASGGQSGSPTSITFRSRSSETVGLDPFHRPYNTVKFEIANESDDPVRDVYRDMIYNDPLLTIAQYQVFGLARFWLEEGTDMDAEGEEDDDNVMIAIGNQRPKEHTGKEVEMSDVQGMTDEELLVS